MHEHSVDHEDSVDPLDAPRACVRLSILPLRARTKAALARRTPKPRCARPVRSLRRRRCALPQVCGASAEEGVSGLLECGAKHRFGSRTDHKNARPFEHPAG